MTIKVKMFEDGDMQANEEFIEIPQELVGTRNLFVKNKIENLAVSGSVADGSIVTSNIYRGYIIPIKKGEVYSIGRDDISNNRFEYGFTVNIPKNGEKVRGGLTFRSSLKIENIIVPEGYNYMFLYLSNQSDIIPNIKIERNSICTSWTPAPEDLGFDIPMSIQNFDNPIQFNEESISSRELVEIPSLLTSGRNFVQNSKDEFSFKNTIYNTPLSVNVFKNFIGKKLTVSFEAKAEADNQKMDCYLRNVTNASIISGAQKSAFVVAKEFTKYSFTFTLSDISSVTSLSFAFRNTSSVSTVYERVFVRNIKIELGEKVTPFSLALEDLGYNNVPYYSKMGNRNLLKTPSSLTNWSSSSYVRDGYKHTISTASLGGIRINENIFDVDTDYVLSFDIKKISGDIISLGGHSGFYKVKKIEFDGKLYSEGIIWSTGIDNFPNDNLTHNVKIYMRTSSVKSGDVNIYIQPNRPTGYNQAYSAEISNLKVEKGLTATDWSPAPEDIGVSNIPEWIQNFNNSPVSINPKGLSLSGEFSEYPNVVEDGLESWYDFKGLSNSSSDKSTVYDISGNLNNGTLSNFSFADGSGYQKGLKLDGIDDYITIKNPLNDKYTNLEQRWTVEFLARLTPTEVSRNLMEGMHLGIRHYPNGKFLNYLNSGSDDYYRYSLNNVIDYNKYQLYTFSFDNATTSINIYVDSVNVNSSTMTNRTSTPLPMNENLVIGRQSDCEILSVRFYSRMLTDEEIKYNYEVERARWSI